MVALSILDLVMIGEGKDLSYSLADARHAAQRAEKAGYKRYWIAEHHNMPGIGSAATTLIMSHVAAGTVSIRVGSGGIMLPNHPNLVVAEQFGTLDTLFPGRIDMGLGRAPGSDTPTVRAIRGSNPETRDFAHDVQSLLGLMEDRPASVRSAAGRRDVPIWILGSGVYGAQLAASLGLPFAFASHFAPRHLLRAIALYRENFRPSAHLDAPYVMAGVCVFAADTFQEADYLASSHRQWVANLHAGRPGPLPKPVEGFMEGLEENRRIALETELACSVVGDTKDVGDWLHRFAEITTADELMIDTRIYDVERRCRSYELAAQSLGLPN